MADSKKCDKAYETKTARWKCQGKQAGHRQPCDLWDQGKAKR